MIALRVCRACSARRAESYRRLGLTGVIFRSIVAYRLHESVSNSSECSVDSHGTEGGPAAMVERLRVATNAHDLEAVVSCFAADYRNETPAHPERGFTGRDQVRRNWEQIFAAVPDVTAEVVRGA